MTAVVATRAEIRMRLIVPSTAAAAHQTSPFGTHVERSTHGRETVDPKSDA